jgi:hypothetical protein
MKHLIQKYYTQNIQTSMLNIWIFKSVLTLIFIITGYSNVYAQTWEPVGRPDFSPGMAGYPSIAIDPYNTPYVAYKDWYYGAGVTVMKYDGSSWVTVGSPSFSDGQVILPCIAMDGSNSNEI